jgi:hypothetical protein
MSVGARVASFSALLVAIFALAVLAGRELEPATEAAGSADHAESAAGGGGGFAPLPLPPEATTASVDGYDVQLDDDRGDEEHPELRFTVTRDGAPVTDLQPYLGARGHLVMLRAGDLAYDHVHPLAADELAFATDDLQTGTYRLFLQFRHGDEVHTAAFTRAVTP